jgi:PAS domain S-box-containing protein
MPHVFEEAFHAAAIGMAVVSLEGRFLRVNPAFCRIVGYSETEMLSRAFHDITHPEDLGKDLSFVRQMVAGEIATYEMEKRYLRKDGETVWVSLSVSIPAEKRKRSPRRFFSQVQDITARKIAEERLRASIEKKQQLYEQLREATQEIAKLQEGLVTICAWTKQIRCGDEWKSVEQFLTERLHLKLSHGMSEDIARQMLEEAKREVAG